MRAWVVVGLAVVTGCTYQRSVADVHELAGKRVIVEVMGERDQQGVVLQVPDGLILRTTRGDMPLTAATRVIEIKRVRGALQGMAIGAMIGAASGAILGYADGDDTCEGQDFCILQFTAGEKAVLGGLVVGTLGTAVGLLVGAVHGSYDVYDVGAPPRFVPTGPPGSVMGATVRF